MSQSSAISSKKKPCLGDLGIDLGFAFFIGEIGDNRAHAHWAHQCIIRLDQAFTLISADTDLGGDAIFVPAGVEHRLIAPRHLSLFFDPTTPLAQALSRQLGHTTIACALPQELADFFKESVTQTDSTQQLHQHCLRYVHHFKMTPEPDPRLGIILQKIHQELSEPASNRHELAQLLGLSDSRFSHWFREQTGMPLRSYRKWLRLVLALKAILAGNGAVDAAQLAGFSDQAHFSRTFLAMFGVTPMSLLPNLTRRA